MAKVLKSLGILGLAVAALAFPAAWAIDAAGTDAYMIAGKDRASFAVNEELFDPPKGASKDSKAYRDEVLRIYGVPTDDTTKVVFWPKEKFIHPKQLPSITILPVYKEQGENPWQVKTIYFLATRTCIAAAVGGVVLWGIGAASGRKKHPSVPPAA